MKKKFISAAILIVLSAAVMAHDLFLKLDNYFVHPGDKVSVKVLNGSFMESEGPVTYSRLADVAVVTPDGARSKPPEGDLTKDAKTAYLNVQTKQPGTYVAGLSTMTREIQLAGKDFNEYLVEDGIPDTLADRKKKNEMDRAVNERYSKHVKAIFQAGDKRTDNFKTALGYPVEIIPVTNPYSLKVGDQFEFVCLKDGKPIANQFVMTGFDDGSKFTAGENVRTDASGVARVKLTTAGKWYVKFIYMARMDQPKLDYESKWASLSFGVR